MRYRVRITAKAERDVDRVLAWFADQGALAAGGRWHDRLMAKITTLERYPGRCPIASESDELGCEIRELLFGKRKGVYRLLFQIDGDTVYLLRVWHSARDAVTREDL